MFKKPISLAVTIVGTSALAWVAACSSSNSNSGGSTSTSTGSSHSGGSSSGSTSGSSTSGSGSSSTGSGSGTSSTGTGSSASSASSASGGGGDGGGGPAGSCSGPVGSNPLIDNMSSGIASKISFTLPGASKGLWFDYGAATTTTPTPGGSFTYTTPPKGFPVGVDAGTAAAGDAGASGPMAACVSGTTGAAIYSSSGVGVQLATCATGDAGASLPALVDASAYTGVQFYIWQPATGPGAPGLSMQIADVNETAGYGKCDPTNNAGTACGGATTPVTIGTPDANGWALVQVPFVAFIANNGYGDLNESMLDPMTVAKVQWQIQQAAADAGAGVAFNFCLYDVAFYH